MATKTDNDTTQPKGEAPEVAAGAPGSPPTLLRAEYTLLDGTTVLIPYDPSTPCILCGKPVGVASVGGTCICSWCDCGVNRNGRKLTYRELFARQSKANTKVD